MSVAKRPIRSTSGALPSASPHASKRQKTASTSHVSAKTGLEFLVDEEARAGKKLGARLTNGVPKAKSSRVDESHALVAPDTGAEDEGPAVNGMPYEVIDISSGEEESSSDDESVDEEQHVKLDSTGGADEHEDELAAEEDRMEGVERGAVFRAAADTDDDQGEPSFADVLRARHPDMIDVQASLSGPSATRSVVAQTTPNRAVTAASATSLGTVLTQALKTNDKDLLESCFQVTELSSVRSTIQRLQSHQASTLLQRLAERIHKRPGRTSNLMVWVQWTLVTHGGYLATQPEVMKKLRSLAQVVRERASGLQPLLHLKGKLDLLSAQLELRRDLQGAARARNAEEEDDEDAVLYIEGQDDDWSDGDEIETSGRNERRTRDLTVSKPQGQTITPRSMAVQTDDGSDDGMPNGFVQASDDESEEDEGEGQGLYDEEAEETSDDDAEEASSADEDQSNVESEDETEPSEDASEPEIKQPPPKALNRKR
ncbi:hypothetical protein B0A50_01074 [Salinomyces thailandicus]|uniref:Small-subunit processome Utp12 domain-containing protein n=1 Tax=Salinomyces thailandicus TaxID=706561 RepID=A0A4U0UBU0_9PEZI|nr:hypothetical protein B0A50_01074 [Salinomyces thailandica]